MNFCPFEGYPGGVPRCYQEAFLLHFADSEESPDNVPAFIDREVLAAFGAFMREYTAGTPAETVARQFGSTYWFYYFYRTGK